jgi:hypothetical protein
MSKRRKVRDVHEARRCLAAARRAGESAGAWARANGIDGRSLNAWRINLARNGGAPARSAAAAATAAITVRPRAALVELVPAAPPAAPPRYVVLVGAVRVEVGDDFDVATLRRLVGALRAC